MGALGRFDAGNQEVERAPAGCMFVGRGVLWKRKGGIMIARWASILIFLLGGVAIAQEQDFQGIILRRCRSRSAQAEYKYDQ